jgi:hypothetical protein
MIRRIGWIRVVLPDGRHRWVPQKATDLNVSASEARPNRDLPLVSVRTLIPVLTQVVAGVLDGHPIDAGTALVLSNAFPRSYEILSVAHLLHQLFRHSRAFGCWLRHEGFDPLVAADRGFTLVPRFQGQ